MKIVTNVLKTVWQYLEGLNGIVFALYALLVFGTAAFTQDYYADKGMAMPFLAIFGIALLACPAILRIFQVLEFKKRELKYTKLPYVKLILKLAIISLFYIIPYLYLNLFYTAYAPGGFSPDSFKQYTQVLTGEYNDWHPVLHSLLAFKLPLDLTGGDFTFIAKFQVIWFSIAIGYALSAVYKYTRLRYAVIGLVFLIINPRFGYIALFVWKDMAFAICALFLITFALHIYMSKGAWLKSYVNMAALIVISVVATFVRHNGLLFTIPLLAATFFFINFKKTLVIALSFIILCLGIKFPLYSALKVEAPDQRVVESMGLPLTVIAGVVVNDFESLDEETEEFVRAVAPIKVWEDNYKNLNGKKYADREGTFNYIKWNENTNIQVIEDTGRAKIISMMFSCFKNSPKESYIALIKLTNHAYTLTDSYNEHLETDMFVKFTNTYGIEKTGDVELQSTLKTHYKFMEERFGFLFLYLGLLHLILVVSILAKCKLTKFKDLKTVFFILPVLIYNFGSTLLLTGYDDAHRFFFYTYLLMPVLLVFLYKKNDDVTDTDTLGCILFKAVKPFFKKKAVEKVSEEVAAEEPVLEEATVEA